MKKLLSTSLGLLCAAAPVLAQQRHDPNADAGAACGVAACGIVVWLIMFVLMIGVTITVDVIIFKFIKRDAIARGLPPTTSMPWLCLLGLLGLLIYVLQRPQGNVVPCHVCGKNRMQGLQRCPNCGNP